MTEPTAQSVADKAQAYLRNRALDGITLEVVPGAVRDMGGWWQVSVRPSAWPKPLFSYYEALAEVEAEIEEHEGLNVLFATGEPVEKAA